METTYLLALIATTIEMTVCLVNARQLWRLRKFSYDRSRRMLILGNALCGMLALWVLVLNIVTVNHHLVTPVLNPWIAWSYMVMNIVMTLYPISVIQPEWLSLRRYFYLFLPTLILGLGCFIFTGRWTQLATPADIWHHVWAPDVLLRLVTLFIMLPYCFILLRLPHSYKSSSASFWWILNYSGGLLILCIVHVVLMLTNIIWLIIVLPLLVASFFLFLPTLILGLGCLVFTGRWTPLATPADIWHHVWEPDVLLRLITLFIMLPYCFILLRLPHSYKSSSASIRWIINYSGGLFLLCVVHIVLMLTNLVGLIILLPLLVSVFFLLSMEFELEERMLPSPEPEEKPSEETDPTPLPEAEQPTPQPEPEVVETDIWERVCYYMDREKVWKDPDLTLVSLSRLCATNITYLNRVIKKETGSGFKDMVNKKRVAEVATQLEQNADMDLLAAFFNAGYRSRTTAWRNFKEITGESPAEYKQRLKNS